MTTGHHLHLQQLHRGDQRIKARVVREMKNKISFLKSILLFLSLSVLASSKFHGNQAHEMVSILNQNRTSRKLGKLNESPGLGCIALQYVEFCEGNCNVNNTLSCEPPQDDFTQVFAPNCGVELPTFGTITGHILGCSSKYVALETAFSDILFFWCLLFSNGGTNSSFALEDNGRGIKQRKGCYSGSAFPCSNAQMTCMRLLNSFLGILLSSFCLFKKHLTC